jgi:hypothetical protein
MLEKLNKEGIDNLKDSFMELINSNSIRRIAEEDEFYVYDNQIKAAEEVIYSFFTKQNRWCLLIAEMQAGKSGTFFSIPYIISKNKILIKKLGIDIHNDDMNVWLLTGMSDKELIEQFEGDIAQYTGKADLCNNIFNNPTMLKYYNKTQNELNLDSSIQKMRKNSLILIDESHYGADKKQTLNKFLTKVLGINPNGDNTELIEKNIYVVSISATPVAEFIESETSIFNKKLIYLENSEKYWGISDMFNNNKIHKSWDLKSEISIDGFINSFTNINNTGYILIRCSEAKQKDIEFRLFEKNIDYDKIEYNSEKDNKNITIKSILDNKPNKYTIVFIRGKLRAGKRINKKHIIMVHDTADSNVDTTVQSLLGRCCGYPSKKSGYGSHIEVYCDDISAKKYKNWVDSKYDISMVPDKSKNVGKDRVKTTKSEIIDVKEFIDDNDYIINIIRKNKGKNKEIRAEILNYFNDNDINNIISGKIYEDYSIGTIYEVDKDFVDEKGKNTNYTKQFIDCLGDFKSDIKGKNEIDISEIGKKIFHIVYEKQEKKIKVAIKEIIPIDAINKSKYKDGSLKTMFDKNNITI